jgi:hypothetical protein
MKKISSIELANSGWLLVNIPSITIILIVWYCLAAYLGINGKISAIVGGALGWIYWELTVKKWIKWALDNNVEPDRLLRIGKLSLLLWNSRQIDEVLNKKK